MVAFGIFLNPLRDSEQSIAASHPTLFSSSFFKTVFTANH